MRKIEQGLLLIHFKFVITAHLDAINQIKDSEQACKQVKYDVKTSVVPLIFSISSESSALFASDLIPAAFIVQGITQPLNDRISQPFSVSALDLNPATSISSIMMQLLSDEIFMHFTLPALNSSSAVSIISITMQLLSDEIFMHFTLPAFDSSFTVMISSIIRQLTNDENLTETSSAVLQQQSVLLTLCQTSELSDIMTLLTISAEKSKHHVFIILKLMSEVLTFITSFF